MNNTKKIVLIGSAFPYRGGLASYNERLISEYIEKGADGEIFTFSLQYPNFLFPGKTQYSTSPPPKGVPIKVKVNSINPFNWIKVGRELKKLQPDLIIVKYWLPFMSPCFSTIIRIAKKNKKTKVLSIIDNIIPHEKRIGDTLLSQYFSNSVDGFVVMSQAVMDDLSQFDTKKPRTLSPHPLFDNFGEKITRDRALSFLNLDSSYKYVLFFGLIRDYKGLDLLIEAFSDDWFKEQKIKLIIAGEYYSDEEKYLSLIREKGIEDQVIHANRFIPNEEVANYFCAADITALPYKSATQSGVTQIAFHFQTPMLVTDVGGLKELVPHEKIGYVTNPDALEIRESLKKFFEENRKDDFVLNLAEEKKKYSWSAMVDSISQVEEQIKKNDL